MLLGLVLYLIYVLQQKAGWRDFKAGLWVVGTGAFVTLMSYLGSFGGKNIIPYPWDNLVVLAGCLIFYYWGVASGYRTEEAEQLERQAEETSP